MAGRSQRYVWGMPLRLVYHQLIMSKRFSGWLSLDPGSLQAVDTFVARESDDDDDEEEEDRDEDEDEDEDEGYSE
jgi:hypothetical protein